MNTRALTPTPQKSKGFISLSALVLIGFCSAFYPRVLLLVKAPSVVTLAHLIIIPIVCGLTLAYTQIKSRKHILKVWELLIALSTFLAVNLASAALNSAGIVNAFVNVLLLCEHFLLLLAIVSLSLTGKKLKRFRAFIIFASFTNLIFAYAQRYGLNLHMQVGLQDNIKGVFINGGAGHVVGASVALTFGFYYLVAAKRVSLLGRAAVLLAAFWHMNMADAKQVLLVFLVAGVLLIMTKFKRIGQAIKYIMVAAIVICVLFWAINKFPALGGFLTWARPEIYGSEGEATLLKTAAFRIVPTYYDSIFSPWLGIGPGHTVTRLGGWMLLNYWNLLGPLGATVHPASSEIWGAVAESWLGDQSSLFSPLFGWAGIWGDLGILGLASFAYIWWVVWRQFCSDDISRFLVLTVIVFGFIFSQMEEPGYMLYVVTIIGLRWHENQAGQRTAHQRALMDRQGIDPSMPPADQN